MLPRSQASEANLKKKAKAFEERRMTSHWPMALRLFPENPRTYGNEKLISRYPVKKSVLNETNEMKRLAGVIPY